MSKEQVEADRSKAYKYLIPNKIMKEQLISFETAKLAKSKGLVWDGKGNRFLNDYLPYLDDGNVRIDFTYNGEYFPCCPQSLLQKWLREKYDIHIIIAPFIGGGSGVDEVFEVKIVNFYNTLKDIGTVYDTYEEALEVGLFEALQNVTYKM